MLKGVFQDAMKIAAPAAAGDYVTAAIQTLATFDAAGSRWNDNRADLELALGKSQ